MSIYNVLGEQIYTRKITGKQETVSCKEYSSGMYYISIENAKSSWVGRFVKQ